MGVRERVVRQTITETFCDYCKREVPETDAKIGTLAIRAKGQRGRPSEVQVAFHTDCLAKITDTAVKPRRRRAARSRADAAQAKATAKKAAKRTRTKKGE